MIALIVFESIPLSMLQSNIPTKNLKAVTLKLLEFIHSVAQSIITLLAFKDFGKDNVDLAHAVFKWAMANMWDERG